MTHQQIIAKLTEALHGTLALGQVTPQRPGMPTNNPPRHLSLAVTAIEDALARIGNAEALERAYATGDGGFLLMPEPGA